MSVSIVSITMSVFFAGFIGGIVFFVIFILAISSILERKGKNSDDEIEKNKAEEERAKMKKDISKSPIDEKSKTLKRFRIKNTWEKYNAHFDNDEVFIAFNFEYTDDPQLPPLKENEVLKFDDLFFYGFYGHHFAETLEKGEAFIFSKSKGKIVDEIMREDSGAYLSHKDRPELYNYYLPDGVRFLSLVNFIIDVNIGQASSGKGIRSWLCKFLP